MAPPPQIVFINKEIITRPEDKAEEDKINDLFLAFEMCVSWSFCFCLPPSYCSVLWTSGARSKFEYKKTFFCYFLEIVTGALERARKRFLSPAEK